MTQPKTHYWPEDSSKTPRFAGPVSFLRLPQISDPSLLDIAVVGVPWDGGTTNRPGARHGPRDVREQSMLIRPFHHVTQKSPYDECAVADMGDAPINPVDLNDSLQRIEDFFVKIHKAGAAPLSVGGDHLISLPILRAIAKDSPVGLIHFDAHTDTNDNYFGGNKYTHGTPFRRAVEEGLIDPKKMIQIGIRGTRYRPSGSDFAKDNGIRVIYIEEFYRLGTEGVISEIQKVIGDTPAYVTFDVDALDPAYAPGTGTPEVGGYSTFDGQQMIRGLSGLNLIGGDVVEVSPPLDPSGATSLVGATLMFEILAVLAESIGRSK